MIQPVALLQNGPTFDGPVARRVLAHISHSIQTYTSLIVFLLLIPIENMHRLTSGKLSESVGIPMKRPF